MPQTTLHPIGVTDLPTDSHACAGCGLPVSGPTDQITVLGIEQAPGLVLDAAPGAYVEFGTCDECAARHDLARAIIAAHPRLRTWYGSPRILADRLDYALSAIAAIGQPVPNVDEWTAQAVADALTRLERLGFQFRWSRRFAPIRGLDVKVATAASERWLYASSEAFEEARHAYREWLVDRIPGRPIACPTAACLACGRDAHPGRRLREAWTPITSGPHRGQHLCVTCAKHYDSMVIGPALIDACLLDHIDPTTQLRKKRPYPPKYRNAGLWIDSGHQPSAEPWKHLDLTAIRHDIETGAW